MVKTLQGNFSGKGKRIGIVISRFNEFISKKLLEGAMDGLLRNEVDEKNITVVWCPGSFEIPAVAKKLASSKGIEGVICLGAILRGDTPHFDYVAAEATKGIAQAGLDTGIPVLFGVITADTLEQAIERAGTKAGNKGFAAALSCLEMVNLYTQFGK